MPGINCIFCGRRFVNAKIFSQHSHFPGMDLIHMKKNHEKNGIALGSHHIQTKIPLKTLTLDPHNEFKLIGLVCIKPEITRNQEFEKDRFSSQISATFSI